MAGPPVIYIVCSDQHRNGKTLLARVLVDFLLLEGRDPFALDLSHPEGILRSYFPGRTALVDFSHITGQMLAIDTILQAPGRDYVIDVAVQHLQAFYETVKSLDVLAAARAAGLSTAVLCIVDRSEESLKAATILERAFAPALFVPVRNEYIGSSLPRNFGGVAITLEQLPPELREIVYDRRFSFRDFVLGDEGGVPLRLRATLRSFLHTAMTGLADIGPALSLLKLRG